MIIKDIRDVKTNKTRTDGRYPKRIGSEVDLLYTPVSGVVTYFIYKKDNKGNRKDGTLRTSTVTNVEYRDGDVIITTLNSIYHLTEENI